MNPPAPARFWWQFDAGAGSVRHTVTGERLAVELAAPVTKGGAPVAARCVYESEGLDATIELRLEPSTRTVVVDYATARSTLGPSLQDSTLAWRRLDNALFEVMRVWPFFPFEPGIDGTLFEGIGEARFLAGWLNGRWMPSLERRVAAYSWPLVLWMLDHQRVFPETVALGPITGETSVWHSDRRMRRGEGEFATVVSGLSPGLLRADFKYTSSFEKKIDFSFMNIDSSCFVLDSLVYPEMYKFEGSVYLPVFKDREKNIILEIDDEFSIELSKYMRAKPSPRDFIKTPEEVRAYRLRPRGTRDMKMESVNYPESLRTYWFVLVDSFFSYLSAWGVHESPRVRFDMTSFSLWIGNVWPIFNEIDLPRDVAGWENLTTDAVHISWSQTQ